jgi:hypothetical protein
MNSVTRLAALIACAVIASGCTMLSTRSDSQSIRAIALPAPTDAERSALRSVAKGAPLQVGFGREIPHSQGQIKLRELSWAKAGGVYVAHVSVQSTGAKSLRLAMRLNKDVASLECVFNSSLSVSAAALVRNASDAPYWSPVIPADTVTIEFKTKSLPDNSVILELPSVSHIS